MPLHLFCGAAAHLIGSRASPHLYVSHVLIVFMGQEDAQARPMCEMSSSLVIITARGVFTLKVNSEPTVEKKKEVQVCFQSPGKIEKNGGRPHRVRNRRGC